MSWILSSSARRNPYRGERRCLAQSDLARLAQLEQREQRNRLLDAREIADLGVEVEPAPPAEERAEALEELRYGREAQAPCARARHRRGRREERKARSSAAGSCGASVRSGCGRERRRTEPEPAVLLRAEPLSEPGCRLLHPPVLGEPPRELLGGLLGLELAELGRLVREERARLQLEQRGDEHEELAARLEIELVSLRHELDEGEHDRRDVDVARLELLLQEKREEQVERALERVEVELELTHGGRGRRRHGAEASPRPRTRLSAATSRSPSASRGRTRLRAGTRPVAPPRGARFGRAARSPRRPRPSRRRA